MHSLTADNGHGVKQSAILTFAQTLYAILGTSSIHWAEGKTDPHHDDPRALDLMKHESFEWDRLRDRLGGFTLASILTEIPIDLELIAGCGFVTVRPIFFASLRMTERADKAF